MPGSGATRFSTGTKPDTAKSKSKKLARGQSAVKAATLPQVWLPDSLLPFDRQDEVQDGGSKIKRVDDGAQRGLLTRETAIRHHLRRLQEARMRHMDQDRPPSPD